MSRLPLIFSNFSKGLVIKPDFLGEPMPLRMEGFEYRKIGGLGYAGGATEYPVTSPTDFSIINGLKKWYRKDGGSTTFLMGSRVPGSSGGLHQIDMPSNNLSLIQTIPDTEYDFEAPALWVNCDDQLLLLLDGMLDRPYTAKLNGAGYSVSKLGLSPPSETLTLTRNTSFIPASVTGNRRWLGLDAVGNPLYSIYSYKISYSYGTPEALELYGESSLGPASTIAVPNIDPALGSYYVDISGISGSVPSGVTQVNIYRTLASQNSYYKINTIRVGLTSWRDHIPDSSVDTSKVPPTLTGLPSVMRVARWHNGRLYWFGTNGRLHVSAAGLPDVNPANYYVDAGNVAYRGNWIGIIRDTIFVGKEDGIYLIQGSVPNLSAKKIESTKSFCRTSFVEMPDGIYFLGERDKTVAVYRFNGNQAIPISDQIRPLLTGQRELLYKKAFARRVGDEYWLAITCDKSGASVTEPNYTLAPLPFNNIILKYNYKNGGWHTFLAQAGSIEVFDGFGDSGEVYYTESDNSRYLVINATATSGSPNLTVTDGSFANVLVGSLITSAVGIPANTKVLSISAASGYNTLIMDKNATVSGAADRNFIPDNKGKLWRIDPYAKNLPLSWMGTSGATLGNRLYSKTNILLKQSKLAIGPIFDPHNPYNPLLLQKLIVNIRDCGYVAGILKLYDANLYHNTFLQPITNEATAFPTVPDSSKLGNAAALLGAIVLQPLLLIRQEFNLADVAQRLGYVLEYNLTINQTDLHLDFEFEGMELIYETTDPEAFYVTNR